MMRLTVAVFVAVVAFVGSAAAQYPEPNELQLAKDDVRKAAGAFDEAVRAGIQRNAAVSDEEALRNEMQARQQLRAASERVRELRRQVVPFKSCVLPDGTLHAVDSIVTFRGRTMQCVIVLDHDLRPSDVSWTASSLSQR